jgi:hypothetical protein
MRVARQVLARAAHGEGEDADGSTQASPFLFRAFMDQEGRVKPSDIVHQNINSLPGV